MRLSELLKILNRIEERRGGDLEVMVMIETTGENACQYEFPANDVGATKDQLIIMHDAWEPDSESEEE